MFRIWILFFVLLISCKVSADQAKALHLTSHNLTPYSYYNSTNEFTGAAYNVIRCALDQINYSLRLSVVPWKRAQRMVQIGQADGFFAASQKDIRDEYAVMTTPIADQNWVWFWHNTQTITPKQTNFKQRALVSSFVGANMQYWLEKEDYQTPSRVPATTKQLMLMVKAERINVGLANQAVLEHLIQTMDLKGEFEISLLKEKPLGAYISKRWLRDHQGFMKQINPAIESCRASQNTNKVMLQYR